MNERRENESSFFSSAQWNDKHEGSRTRKGERRAHIHEHRRNSTDRCDGYLLKMLQEKEQASKQASKQVRKKKKEWKRRISFLLESIFIPSLFLSFLSRSPASAGIMRCKRQQRLFSFSAGAAAADAKSLHLVLLFANTRRHKCATAHSSLARHACESASNGEGQECQDCCSSVDVSEAGRKETSNADARENRGLDKKKDL